MQVDKDGWEKARRANTLPAHEIAAGDYSHPAYGLMSIRERDGVLHWPWRGLFAIMAHRHYETFELPEVPDRHVPDRLPLTFVTDRDGNIVSLSAPLEPAVKDIVFTLEPPPSGRCSILLTSKYLTNGWRQLTPTSCRGR
jgi:hypothetical protein